MGDKSLANEKVYYGSRTTCLQAPVPIVGKTPSGGNATAGMTEPAFASNVLTSDNTNVADGATVTINGRVYTFKTALTASTTLNEVLIGADADGSLANLRSAVNGTGAPGTDYGSLTTANADGRFGSTTAHAIAFTALLAGGAGNSVATTETSAHLSWATATLAGGAYSKQQVDATITATGIARTFAAAKVVTGTIGAGKNALALVWDDAFTGVIAGLTIDGTEPFQSFNVPLNGNDFLNGIAVTVTTGNLWKMDLT